VYLIQNAHHKTSSVDRVVLVSSGGVTIPDDHLWTLAVVVELSPPRMGRFRIFTQRCCQIQRNLSKRSMKRGIALMRSRNCRVV
ncbi:unnamed protein product, partial [Mycena citricolor]